METTKLETIEAVSQALSAEFALDGVEMRTMKPAERRQRASRIADLFEIRVALFDELLDRLHQVVVAGAERDVAAAVARAVVADRDSVRFWRGQAGAR